MAGWAVYGTGGMGREAAAILVPQAALAGEDIVFVDDGLETGSICNGLSVIDFNVLQSPQHRVRTVIVAIGSGQVRQRIEAKCRNAGLTIGNIVAASARILGPASLGPGALVCDFAVITSNVTIGRSFQANVFSSVMHDCRIGDYVTLAPRATCNGSVHIGDFAYIGAGALIIQGTLNVPMTIGEGAVVGMGAVVLHPVQSYTVVAGNPARVIRTLPRPPA